MLADVEGIAKCYLTDKDVVRHELVQRIVKAYAEYEKKRAEQPMEEGPFAKFLRAVNKVQNNQDNSPVKIRTALVTSRNAPAHKRVITTLRAWNVRIDETFFLGGLPKTDILKALPFVKKQILSFSDK